MAAPAVREAGATVKWLLLFIATPGSFAIVGLGLRALVRKISKEREADEDRARARRFAHENHIPEEFVIAVAQPSKPLPRHPGISSRYTEAYRDGR